MLVLVDGLFGSLQALPNAYKQDLHWKNNQCFTESYCMVTVETLNSIKWIILTLGFFVWQQFAAPALILTSFCFLVQVILCVDRAVAGCRAPQNNLWANEPLLWAAALLHSTHLWAAGSNVPTGQAFKFSLLVNLSVSFSVLIAFWLEYMWWPLRWLNRASGMFNNCVFSRWMFCEHEYWHYKYTWGMYGNK